MNEPERQKYLQLVTRKLVFLTASALIMLLFIYYFSSQSAGNRSHLIYYVFLAGLIGGFVSIQQRLPTIELKELQELSHSWLSILLIPINGGIFAIVLMLVFLAGILEGSLFPKFTHTEINSQYVVDSFLTWLSMTFPTSGPDIAKLFFWSFVAGFSERFVPQIIRKTSDSANKSKNT